MSHTKKAPKPEEVEAARHDPRLRRARDTRQSDPEWRMRGRCVAVDPETFFPDPQVKQSPRAALAVCQSCAVQSTCLAWALDAGDCNGVWGATTPGERKAMVVAWRDYVPVG